MPMFWAAGLALAGSVGSAVVGSNAAGKAADATKEAAALSTAEQKRQFDTTQANMRPWLATGTSALGKLASLYGIEPYSANAPQNRPDEAATLAKIRQGAQTWESQIPGNGLGIIQMIDGGASLADVTAAMNSLRATTTNARNTAYLDPLIQQAQSPIMGQPSPQAGVVPGGQGTQSTVDPNASFYQSPDYQFRMAQGLRGVDAGAAAGGVLDSGATRKAEIRYAGNLASGEFNTYANRLSALAGVGQTAATNLGNMGANYASAVGNNARWAGDNLASSYLAKGQNYGNTIGQIAGIGSGLIQNNPQWFQPSGGWTAGGGDTGTPGVYITPRVR